MPDYLVAIIGENEDQFDSRDGLVRARTIVQQWAETPAYAASAVREELNLGERVQLGVLALDGLFDVTTDITPVDSLDGDEADGDA